MPPSITASALLQPPAVTSQPGSHDITATQPSKRRERWTFAEGVVGQWTARSSPARFAPIHSSCRMASCRPRRIILGLDIWGVSGGIRRYQEVSEVSDPAYHTAGTVPIRRQDGDPVLPAPNQGGGRGFLGMTRRGGSVDGPKILRNRQKLTQTNQ